MTEANPNPAAANPPPAAAATAAGTDPAGKGDARGGASAVDFRDGLGADERAFVEAKGWRDLNSVVKSYTHLEKTLGGERVALPGKDAKPEDWGAFFDKIGRPPRAEEYELAAPPEAQKFGEDFGPSTEFLDDFKTSMHAAGLTKDQANAVYGLFMKHAIAEKDSAVKTLESAVAKGESELREKWGLNYKPNLETANRGLKFLTGENNRAASPLYAALAQSGLVSNPLFAEAMHRLGQALGEDQIGSPSGALSPESAAAQIKAIMGNFGHAYWKPQDPGHAEAVAHMQELHKILHPKQN